MTIDKTGILYQEMKRGRRKYLILLLLFAALLVWFICANSMYLAAKIHGPYPFNETKQAAFLQTPLQTITKPVTMKKREDRSITSYAALQSSWLYGRQYRFSVTFDEVLPTEVHYDTTIQNPETKQDETYVLQRVYMGKFGTTQIPILAYANQTPQAGQEIAGLFLQPDKVIISDLSADASEENPLVIPQYLFDMRGTEMGTENSDPWIILLWLIVLIILAVRLIRYYVNPYKHPTYRQLEKYGELAAVIADINTQFASDEVYRDDNKELVTPDWCGKRDPFRFKITKNHRAKGRYQ